jgi:hypothetical protein
MVEMKLSRNQLPSGNIIGKFTFSYHMGIRKKNIQFISDDQKQIFILSHKVRLVRLKITAVDLCVNLRPRRYFFQCFK